VNVKGRKGREETVIKHRKRNRKWKDGSKGIDRSKRKERKKQKEETQRRVVWG
jgi:hypothetical protein